MKVINDKYLLLNAEDKLIVIDLNTFKYVGELAMEGIWIY
jgi:hypothetical protein